MFIIKNILAKNICPDCSLVGLPSEVSFTSALETEVKLSSVLETIFYPPAPSPLFQHPDY